MTAPRRSSTRAIRWIVQLAMVTLVGYVGLRHQIVGGAGGAAPLDSFCPFGAIETLPSLLGGTGFIAKVGTSNLVLLGALGIVTLGLGASFCGWLCPFGAIQDVLSLLRRALFGRSILIPDRIHRVLKQLRWVVLALVVWMSWRVLGLWFADYDPFRALFHFKFESWVAVALVGLTVVGGLLVERFWCLYLCPLGAVVGALGMSSMTKVRRSEAQCTECSLCSRACPSRIDVQRRESVRDQHCTMCGECVDACPHPGALTLSTGVGAESLRPVSIGIATVVLFAALVGTAFAMGWWQTGAGCAGCSVQSSPQTLVGYNVVTSDERIFSVPATQDKAVFP